MIGALKCYFDWVKSMNLYVVLAILDARGESIRPEVKAFASRSTFCPSFA